MMLYPTMPELMKNIDSRYMLVNVIAKRAREIAEKAEQEEEILDEKPVSTAVKEIARGEIRASAVQDTED